MFLSLGKLMNKIKVRIFIITFYFAFKLFLFKDFNHRLITITDRALDVVFLDFWVFRSQ